MRNIRFPIFDRLHTLVRSFSFVERVFFFGFVILLVIGSIGLLSIVNDTFLVTVPAPGGSITEGIIGAPRFINPVLALSDADRDLTMLVYSGLMRATPEGTLIPDLAEKVVVSDDGLVYTFTLRKDAVFHDGTPVSARDVVYTVKLAQNPDVKSPKRANWEGVRVDMVDSRTVQFTLAQTYAPFLENTTMGILPEHLWKDIQSDQILFSTYNTDPIGSGPFRVTHTTENNAGIPTAYELTRFDEYTLGAPYLETINMRFYPNEEELVSAFEHRDVNDINSIEPSVLPSLSRGDVTIHTSPLPRIFGIFFNQDEASVFTSQSVREALNIAIDREKIVDKVLDGYGIPIDEPLPQLVTTANHTKTTVEPADPERAAALLEEAGWELDEETGIRMKGKDDERTPLHFSLATSNIPELKHVAEIIQQEWEALGVQVDLQFFDTSTLNQEVIRPRQYEALLFGQIVGRTLDPFAFWHSSQRNDPGLNIALYANITADRALEKIRTTVDPEVRMEQYRIFEEEVRSDVPAVFLYAPSFIYITDNTLQGIKKGIITTAAERFVNVYEWHIYTQKVWRFFSNK